MTDMFLRDTPPLVAPVSDCKSRPYSRLQFLNINSESLAVSRCLSEGYCSIRRRGWRDRNTLIVLFCFFHLDAFLLLFDSL